MAWLHRTWSRLRALARPVPEIPAALWLQVLQKYPFLQALSLEEKAKLRALSALFLRQKQFSGAHGLVVSDAMALTIAAQACVPLLHRGEARQAIALYDDFVGIVVHPGTMVAARDMHDEAGLISHRRMMLEGEAMQHGPVTLSWAAIAQDPLQQNARGTSVVIHEFCHKIDMRNGGADGYPSLPGGFLGLASAAEARQTWERSWASSFQAFGHAIAKSQRFGEPAPWLDSYGATAPAEFFAVACEAYFVNRSQFAQEWPQLDRMLSGLFRPDAGRPDAR
ncbi:Mlc titration factor MtfA (ptsG expression regulator) [Comamonas sp. BIGb0152]|uniref:M90 family metallopeptidase n=1 Tax=Comamonas sp. BIGb0152 TaxID=2940601 RepID=UPI002167F825|nr:M90 family metallopeptidase [Comamonas sp. BIGb0152]MCS4293227.1 Mlc titration factor MtfA (ptsG expression regulator) [Comamonas sp. BIGb0152]